MSFIRHRRRVFLFCKETGMQKWAGMLVEIGKAFVDPSAIISPDVILCGWLGSNHQLTNFCNDDTNEGGLRLLGFASFNDLVLANTFCHHKASRKWTWHSRSGQYHNQTDYILVRKHFRSGVNIAKTRSFPGADIGNEHDLLMMTFRLRLKKNQQANTHKTQVWPRKAERS